MDAEQRVRAERTDYGVFERVHEARRWFEAEAPSPARVRVVGDDDSDGVSSAHIVTHALRRAGYEVTPAGRAIHSKEDAERAVKGAFDAFVICDAGSPHIETLEGAGAPVLVLDHHGVRAHKPVHVFEVNPRRLGAERTWAVSASVVSALFGLALSKENRDLAYAGLAGAISDRQHLGGWHGLAGYCRDVAIESGNVTSSEGFMLVGPTAVDALAGSFDPYFAAYSGRPDAARGLLASHGIAPGTPPLSLSDAQAHALAETLTRELPSKTTVSERVHPLYADRLLLRHGSGIPSVFHLSRLLEGTTAGGAIETAFRLLAGNPEAAQEAETMTRSRQRHIIEEIGRLRSHVHEAGRFRWAETRDESNTGVYSHALLTFVFGDDKPLVVLATGSRSTKVSARGSPRLFLAGLDLSRALQAAAGAVGGNGGGHPGAAGAKFDAGRRDEFLAALDRHLGGAPA